jgi:uncharacterized protein (TIGR00369 family)
MACLNGSGYNVAVPHRTSPRWRFRRKTRTFGPSLKIFSAQPFMMALGARLGDVEPGIVELILSIRPDHLQHGGAVHGGAIDAMADNAAGAAAATLLALGQATVTAEYRISFLSPAIGDTLIARGEVLKPGRSIIHTKCDVAARAGDRETLVATALSSMVPFAMRSG